MKASYQKHLLKFKFNAGTSRGVLKEKETWFLNITDGNITGLGECGPLKGLSIDDRADFENYLQQIIEKLHDESLPENETKALELAERLVSLEFPAIRFGLEVALLDLLHGGKGRIFSNAFTDGQMSLPINGLIWMGDQDFMLQQVNEKINEGFTCLKLKVGAIDFEKECAIIKHIRDRFSEDKLILRVDANGAFSFDEAKQKLSILSYFNLHSIEQPLKPGQLSNMKALVEFNLLPIALDEELIGLYGYSAQKQLLQHINPPYIILKPTLLGGIKATQQWIEIATELNAGWWITSALESNIGLNAIAQLTANYDITTHQGLGTGQLYLNNAPSNLQIRQGYLSYASS